MLEKDNTVMVLLLIVTFRSRFQGILPILIYSFSLSFNLMSRCALKPKQVVDITALIPHFTETENNSSKFQETNTRLCC